MTTIRTADMLARLVSGTTCVSLIKPGTYLYTGLGRDITMHKPIVTVPVSIEYDETVWADGLADEECGSVETSTHMFRVDNRLVLTDRFGRKTTFVMASAAHAAHQIAIEAEYQASL